MRPIHPQNGYFLIMGVFSSRICALLRVERNFLNPPVPQLATSGFLDLGRCIHPPPSHELPNKLMGVACADLYSSATNRRNEPNKQKPDWLLT
ncbi:hypothetical protein CSKR_114428 [Clonorchis sinensis]|uniref:Uncharacterized protein n=1 Tax=Clonorchis sinensis TaxID=79923 RepID=A0A419QA85_CLOSI|nr:hypothetical protein CSKR_114428 [Clonorchis sinensis]